MLSVIVIVKNEENNLRRCLTSVQWADEIIVLDSGSTDNTVTIAKAFTDKVYETDWQGYGVQKQRALAHATGDWVLNIDADELVSDDLKHAVLSAIKTNDADAYQVPIQLCFYGKLLRYSWSPQRHIRLFKQDGANYSSDLVHESILLAKGARIGKLRAPIIHYCVQDISHLLYKINRYSSYSATMRIQKNKPANFWKTVLSSIWMFFRCYFIQRGFLDGKEGLLFAMVNAEGTFYRGVKQLYVDQ